MAGQMKQWIANAAGTHALVDADAARDLWVPIRGWLLASEPGPDAQVHITRDGLIGQVPFGALDGGWADDGWTPGSPPEPVDLTRDPAPAAPAPKTTAAGGKKTEE